MISKTFTPANPTIRRWQGLAPSLSGGVAGAAASLQQHCQRSLGDLAPQIPSTLRWNRHMVFFTDDWGELRALLRVFLKKGKFGGKKKGKGESIFLLWNWLKNQFKQEVGRWFWGIQVILVSPWHHWWYHRHHAGLLRYDGDELVPSKSLEKELHEIQAKCAGKGTLSPRIMEVMNRSSWRYTHFPFNYACGRKSI